MIKKVRDYKRPDWVHGLVLYELELQGSYRGDSLHSMYNKIADMLNRGVSILERSFSRDSSLSGRRALDLATNQRDYSLLDTPLPKEELENKFRFFLLQNNMLFSIEAPDYREMASWMPGEEQPVEKEIPFKFRKASELLK